MKKNIKKPLVSVLMPVYNGSKFIEEAIESILNQSYRQFELIIADDASKDDTAKILKQYLRKYPKKIQVVTLKQNQGVAQATNAAFNLAKGKYLAIMDCDDIAHSNRLQKQVEFLENHPKVIVLGTQAKIINKKGQIVGEKNFPTTHEKIYSSYGLVHPMVHPSIMIRAKLVPNKGFLYQDKYGIHADYFNLFTFLKHGEFANLPEYLLFYRIHGNNNSLQKLKQSYWTILKIRIEAIFSLNYKFSVVPFFAMIVQSFIVLFLPESILKYLYYSVKKIAVIK